MAPARLLRSGRRRRGTRRGYLPADLRRLDPDPARRRAHHRRPHRAAARARHAQRLHRNGPARLGLPLASGNALDCTQTIIRTRRPVTYASVRLSRGCSKICEVGPYSTTTPVRLSVLLSVSTEKNAVRSLTRVACCMLWVTMTIV